MKENKMFRKFLDNAWDANNLLDLINRYKQVCLLDDTSENTYINKVDVNSQYKIENFNSVIRVTDLAYDSHLLFNNSEKLNFLEEAEKKYLDLCGDELSINEDYCRLIELDSYKKQVN